VTSAKKYLLASLVVAVVVVVVVVSSSSVLLIAQRPDLAASKGSNDTTTVSSLTKTTAQNIDIEAKSTTSLNNLTRSYAEQIMAHCKNDIHCPVLALGVVYNTTESRQIVLRTFSDLVLLYHESYDDCHDMAHHLGTWLYGYTTNVKEALSYAQPLICGGAVLHGIFQGYFVTAEQVHNAVDKNQIAITDHCPVGQENINWMYERECIHGIGHGLTALYDYNTTAAVDRCNEFGPQWAQSACARGVFMQNVVRYYETKTKVGDFDKNNIYFPCDRTIEKFKPQCYSYHALYLLMRNGNNITDAFAQCDKISPSEFAKYCYQGMGRALADTVYTNAELGIASCYLGDQATSYHDECLRGILRVVLDNDVKTDLAFQSCSLSRPDYKAECYEIVGMWIKMLFSPNQQELERECSKARDTDYVINCINASPDTRVHISIFELI
jgi:hypothetical protein